MQEVNGKTGVLGIFGKPVEHTLSPAIHNTISEELKKDLIYVPFHVEDDIEAAVKGAYAMNVKGINVTVPYKQDVIPHLVSIDENAKKIGAVNTLVRAEGGFRGYNTDMMGLSRAMDNHEIEIEDKNVIILGAGGASRAAVYMCMLRKARVIYLVNRSLDKAMALADEMNELFQRKTIYPIAVEDYKKVPVDSYVMLQCTSMGLKEGDGLLINDDEFYDMAECGYDLIYNPAVTPFMRALNQRNIPVYNGLTMLLYQGIIAYELWNDIKIDEKLCKRVLNVLKRKLYGENIILVGYMGSGKTSVGKCLAEKYGMKLVDTDRLIVENEGITINEIFATLGEGAFREMETGIIKTLQEDCCNTVISTGGGMPIKKENQELLKKLGKVVYLNASPEETYERVKNDTERPLLKSGTKEEVKNKIKSMINERRGYYLKASDVEVKVDGRSVEYIADEIISQVK